MTNKEETVSNSFILVTYNFQLVIALGQMDEELKFIGNTDQIVLDLLATVDDNGKSFLFFFEIDATYAMVHSLLEGNTSLQLLFLYKGESDRILKPIFEIFVGRIKEIQPHYYFTGGCLEFEEHLLLSS